MRARDEGEEMEATRRSQVGDVAGDAGRCSWRCRALACLLRVHVDGLAQQRRDVRLGRRLFGEFLIAARGSDARVEVSSKGASMRVAAFTDCIGRCVWDKARWGGSSGRVGRLKRRSVHSDGAVVALAHAESVAEEGAAPAVEEEPIRLLGARKLAEGVRLDHP